jgi:hypothetical protein
VEAGAASEAKGGLKTSLDAKADKNIVPIVSPWSSYSSQLQDQNGTPLAGYTTQAKWRRVGDSAEVHISMSFSNPSPVGFYTWTLPPGVAPTEPDNQLVGMMSISVGSNQTNHFCSVIVRGKRLAGVCNQSTGFVSQENPGILVPSNGGVIRATVQVQGWTTTTP